MDVLNFLTKKDLSLKLDISIGTINRHMANGNLSFIKLGKRVYFNPKQLEKDMEKLQTTSKEQATA